MKYLIYILLLVLVTVSPGMVEGEKELKLRIKPGDIEAARPIRRAELNDPIRPTWHLTIAEGRGYPFDPNGAIFKDGIYHLWYLYQAEAGHHWQHLSSIDLFHWRWHSNDLQHHPGDPDKGIFSGIPSCINEMLLQSYEGVIRVFPNWLPGKEARFKTLRAYGAFLVSSKIKNNIVSYIEIVSEKGREFKLLNPWKTGKVALTAEGIGNIPFIEKDNCIIFKTEVGKTYKIRQNET